MPAIETSIRNTPKAIIGFSRKREHSVESCFESQISAIRMGIERRKVTMFRIPIR